MCSLPRASLLPSYDPVSSPGTARVFSTLLPPPLNKRTGQQGKLVLFCLLRGDFESNRLDFALLSGQFNAHTEFISLTWRLPIASLF